jgi:hypothetical protein
MMKSFVVLAVVLYASSGHAQTVRTPSPSIDKQVLTGHAARTYLEELSHNPEFRAAQEHSRELFESMGMTRADLVVVFQLPQRSDPGGITPLNLGDTTPIHGFMVASAWDDGFPGTWEGNLSWYIDGAYHSSINTQFDLGDGHVYFNHPGHTTPRTPSPTDKKYDGIHCDRHLDIPGKISQNTWNNSWRRILPYSITCTIAGASWFFCVPLSGVSILATEGLYQLILYQRACF